MSDDDRAALDISPGSPADVSALLAGARTTRGLSQVELAEAAAVPVSTIALLETGKQTIPTATLHRLSAILGIDDDVASACEEILRRARLPYAWWSEPDVRTTLGPLATTIDREQAATALSYFVYWLFPLWLCADTYARAVLELADEERSISDQDHLLHILRRHRTAMISRSDAPVVRVLIDESMVMRQIGGAGALRDQLTLLAHLMRAKRCLLRVLPYNEGLSIMNQFTIAESGGMGQVCRRGPHELVELEMPSDEAQVDRFRGRFDKIWAMALNDDDSADLLRSRIAVLDARLSAEDP